MTPTISTPVLVKRLGPTLVPDRSRVLMRPFRPTTDDIARRIVARVMALPEDEAARLLGRVIGEFTNRHERVDVFFQKRFEQVKIYLEPDMQPSPERQMLIGAYFTHEYSVESAALFNPSIVPHPDQSGLPPGSLRFILSLRATGEGHISSITFRTGILLDDHRIEVLTPTGFLTEPSQVPNSLYEKALFTRKLFELGLTGELTSRVMHRLGELFSLQDLRVSLAAEVKQDHWLDGMAEEDLSAAQG